MDSLIKAAARALAAGDPLTALKCVALREGASLLAAREGAPSVAAREGAPSVAAREGAPSVAARKGAPSVAAREGAPSVAAREGAPSVALREGGPSVALREGAPSLAAPSLALRGIAMAQLGEFARAKELLRSAARAFGPQQPIARARCVVAEAEIALVSRDLGRPIQALNAARATLEAHGDTANAAHAGYLEARRLLLIGKLDAAERTLEGLDADALPPASRAGYGLVAAGIAMRRIRTKPARTALDQAARAAREAGIPALMAEVDRASRALEAPAARLIARDGERLLRLEEVEALLASNALVVDA